jgi:transcriptional regulator with XRE-family HTH domain
MSKKEIQKQSLRLRDIAGFIRNWRLNEGLSQREFSKLANVHVNSIYNLEHMRGSNLITLLKCIDAMDGMTLSEFFSGIE